MYKKLREGVAKLKVDNSKALSYESGMMGPGAERQEARRGGQQAQQRQGKGCKHCNAPPSCHSRITSGNCPKNPVNIKKAMEEAALEALVGMLKMRRCDMKMGRVAYVTSQRAFSLSY